MEQHVGKLLLSAVAMEGRRADNDAPSGKMMA
jgi:hypothetical protein